MKVSFCTTCKNRLFQLKEVYPVNLQEVSGEVEFILLNYNSQDGLDEWVRDNLMSYIESGKLVYLHEKTVKYFHAPKAKNIVYRAATGDIVVNLDGDNYIDGYFATILNECSKLDTLLHMWQGDWLDGTFGKIAMPRKAFFDLRGYNEDFKAMGWQDVDLIDRARRFGLRYIRKIDGEKRPLVLNSPEVKMKCVENDLTFDQMN